MPASVVVVSTPEHRAERLAKLNLKEEHFRNAIIAGENARSICTGNHPALYRGMKAWGEGTRTLRDETARSGYVADETAGFATALNRDLGIAIVIAAGDAATGVDRLVSHDIPGSVFESDSSGALATCGDDGGRESHRLDRENHSRADSR